MRFETTGVDGVHLVVVEPAADERGSFARLYCPDEFAAAGILFSPVQTSLSNAVSPANRTWRRMERRFLL